VVRRTCVFVCRLEGGYRALTSERDEVGERRELKYDGPRETGDEQILGFGVFRVRGRVQPGGSDTQDCAPCSVKLVGANQFSFKGDGTTLNLTYEFQFGDKFMLINVARKTKDGTEAEGTCGRSGSGTGRYHLMGNICA
jgi:hypothetical protein